ncbi:MAG: M20/M25/M40 family metallo-hydrolase [Oscillospiraceae bacterium]|nr:M20/M25/M40 family metallo-hydrolase [Oscillospiraceae bacterium]
MTIKEILKTLCLSPSVSGDEAMAGESLRRCLAETGPELKSDALGNFIAVMNPEGSPRIMLEAHLDKIGFIITGIDEKTGFLRIDKVGGSDARVCPAQRVSVFGKRELKGVIISTPPHLAKGDSKKVTPINELAIDCGLPFSEIKDIVSLGDRAMITASFYEMGENIVCAPYLDDSAGAAVLIRAAEILKEKGSKARVELVFSSREEVGGMGAKTAAFASEAGYGIAVDVSFASAPGVKDENSAPLGSGAMIGVSPVLQRKVSDMLKKAAEENGIPHTIEVLGRSTGTDADDIVISKSGILTGLVSVPIRNMHTPVEIADVTDIESAAKLLAEFTAKID